jgi:pimeloyl-ACP methyl ester carboxylesterase
MLREFRTLKQLRKSWYIFLFQLPWLPERMLLRNHASLIGRVLRGNTVQKDAFPPEVIAKYQKAISKPGSMTAALNYYRHIFLQRPEMSSHISAPTLLIWGEQDVALGIELTHGLEQWIDNIQVERISDSGHWVQQEQPDKVNQLMQAFL